jgi:hypothetical protein
LYISLPQIVAHKDHLEAEREAEAEEDPNQRMIDADDDATNFGEDEPSE